VGPVHWPYPGAVADNTRVPLDRTERVLAFAVASVGILSIVSIVVILIARAAGMGAFNTGIWPVIATLPLVGLPLALIGIIAFIVVSGTRRARLARDAGE
jgi:hypothetical protein